MEAVSEVFVNPVFLASAGTLLLAILWWNTSKKNSKFPPGPTPLPFIGNLLDVWNEPSPFNYFERLQKKYGPVFSIKLGHLQLVILNSIDSVREAIVQKQNDYAGRPRVYSADLFSDNGKDIVFGDFTTLWKLQRKIAHGAIRKFLTGSELERRVTEAVDMITEEFQKQKEPFDPLQHLTLMIYNIIANMTFGKRWTLDDAEFKSLVENSQEGTALFGNGLPQDFVPFLRYFPASKKEKQMKVYVDWYYNYLRTIYSEHKETYKYGQESDLMYHLIGMMKEAEAEGDSSLSEITDEHMFQIVSDFFGAGTDTSRYTLHWALCYLAAYPEIQEKMYNEIQNIHGNNPVTLAARDQLNYTDSVLHEILRIKSLAPVAAPHTTTCDTTLGPYDIPKGTWIILNLWALHHDPKEWDDPETFKPERFLDEDGKMAPKPNSYLPFSSGRRVCVGEALAKSELLLSLSLLCQRFKFEAPPGEKIIPEAEFVSLMNIPKPYKIVVIPRKDM